MLFWSVWWGIIIISRWHPLSKARLLFNSEYSLEGLMLKLKLQYFGHLLQRVDSLEKTLMLGGIGGRRRRDDRGWDGWMASLTRWTWVWVNSGRWWWTGTPGVLQFMGSQRVGHDWTTELNTFYDRTNFFSQVLLLSFMLILWKKKGKDKPLSFEYRMDNESWQ